MKIKALEDFTDLEAKKERKKGDIFDVGASRAKTLTTSANRMNRPLCEKVKAKGVEGE